MSDTVVFKGDGTYYRKGEVQRMNIQNENGHPGEETPTVAAPADSVSAGHSPSKTRTGTFNLEALRASAQKVAGGVSTTRMPASSEIKFESVKADESKSAEVVKPEHEKPVKVTEPASTKEGSEEPKPVETSKPAPVEKAVAEPAIQSEAPTVHEAVEKEESPVSAEPVEAASEDLHMDSEAVTAAPEDTSSAPAESSDVKEMHLETTEEKAETPSASTTEEAITAEFSGNGFKLVNSEDFFSQLSLSKTTMFNWCRACVKESVKYPGFLFSSKFKDALRFYNYFQTGSGSNFCAIVGCGDYLTGLKLNMQNGSMQDYSDHLTVTGAGVAHQGDIVVLYEERLHKTRIV